MSLSGRLEDLQLRDLLQIFYASKNSGLLQLENGETRAELLFEDGLVVSAWRENDGKTGTDPVSLHALLRSTFMARVVKLLDWQEGDFTFLPGSVSEIMEQFASAEHRRLEPGLGLDELLNDESDSSPGAAGDGSSAVPASPDVIVQPAAVADPTCEAVAALVVDDDPRVAAGLVAALAQHDLTARSVANGKELLDAARHCWNAGAQPLLIIDLIMPRLHGGGLLGGLELVEQARRLQPEARCLVYSDHYCPEVEQQLRQFHVDELLPKPRPLVFEAGDRCNELDIFCRQLALQAAGLLKDAVVSGEVEPQGGDSTEATTSLPEVTQPESSSGVGLGLLKGMLQELQITESADQVMLLVLRFATEVLDRAVLFSVGMESIVGLGQFGHGDSEISADEKVRRIAIPVAEESSLKEAVEHSATSCRPLCEGSWDAYLRQQLGLEPGDEVFIGPLANAGRVVALLCGDNRAAGVGLFERQMLEIFLQQGGAALERLLLNNNLGNLSALFGKKFA